MWGNHRRFEIVTLIASFSLEIRKKGLCQSQVSSERVKTGEAWLDNFSDAAARAFNKVSSFQVGSGIPWYSS